MEINGISIWNFAFLGMGIVFSGLVVISLYIYGLPHLLGLFTIKKKMAIALPEPAEKVDDEIMLALGVVVHMELSKRDETQKITWLRHQRRESPWKVVGRAESLLRRL